MEKVAMQTNQRIDTYENKIKRNKRIEDLNWCLTLFGTAVGAGMLFLPIRAGISGIWAIIASSLIIGPTIYYAHRGLTRFIMSSKNKNADFVEVIRECFGDKASNTVAFLYFLAFYPVLIVYGVALTNTFNSLFINQFNLTTVIGGQTVELIPRWLIAMVIIFSMVFVMTKSKEKIIEITSAVVYPLAIMLAGISLYLIPYWNIQNHSFAMPKIADFLDKIWITLPILVFSFNHSPSISEFAISIRKSSEDDIRSEKRSSAILRNTSLLLWLFTMFFVFSCIFSLTPNQIQEASDSNISILSYLANCYNNPIISYVAPLIAIVAIVSSFFGHYLGAVEGIKGLLLKKIDIEKVGEKKLDNYLAIFIAISTWLVSIKNPAVLNIIEMIGTPIMAIMLYLIPMYAIYKIEALKKYRANISNIVVIIVGIITTAHCIHKII